MNEDNNLNSLVPYTSLRDINIAIFRTIYYDIQSKLMTRVQNIYTCFILHVCI